MDLVRSLRPEVLDRERREDGCDRVVHLRYRPECSVGVRGGRSDVPEEARCVSVRRPQRVPEHVLSFTLQKTCDHWSDVAPCVVDSPSDVVQAFGVATQPRPRSTALCACPPRLRWFLIC